MLKLLVAFALCLLPSLADAHVGAGEMAGFAHGFAHPFHGPDHVLAMVAVGVMAGLRRGRALWLVPLAFVVMMIVGGGLATAAVRLPAAEIGIGLSVVVLGLAIARGAGLPTLTALALAGFFAVFHGYAHAAEMPETASGLAYGAGFVTATALLHLGGIGLGLGLARVPAGARPMATHVAGGALALAGMAVLTSLL
jgi:urease accessory protein